MRRIKILHVYKSFNVYNGLIEILLILAERLDPERFDLNVCVYRYDGTPFGDKFEKLGGKIHSLHIPKSIYNEPKEFISLYKFLKKFRPDIVQTHVLKANLYGVLASRMAHVPVVIATEMTLKNIAHTPVTRLRDRIIHPAVSAVLNYCDCFMVTSKFIKQEWYREDKAHKFEVIYPPFNLSKYEAAQTGNSARSQDGRINIGYVGRLSEEKGVDLLLESMIHVHKKVKGAHLIIAGTGPIEARLKAQVKALGLDRSVVFTGYKENVFEIMKDFSIFVLPSRTEGCPIVVLEAMAAGLPVVATPVGGTPELIRESQTGLLVPYGKSRALADAILELIEDPGKAQRLGERGREMAFSEFHPSNFVEHMEDLYLRLIANKKVTLSDG